MGFWAKPKNFLRSKKPLFPNLGFGELAYRVGRRKRLPPIQHTCKLTYTEPGIWHLHIPVFVRRDNDRRRRGKVASCDPGVRTFQTCYTTEGAVADLGIGPAFQTKVVDRLHRIDQLASLAAKSNHARRQRLHRKQAALRYKIKNWINEIHWKTARWLCSQHSAVLLGKLNVKALSSKTGGLGAIAPNFVACGHKSLRPKNRGRKCVISDHTFSLEKECGRRPHSFSLAPDPPTMGRSNVRKLYAWSHYKFQQRLLCKAEELCCDAYVVNEAWTSKTCTACGHIHHKLGASKTFECPSCGVVLDRDVNGARNILLKNAHRVSTHLRV